MEILTKDEFYSKDLTAETKRKYCYDLCKSVNFKRRDLVPYADKYGCDPTTLFLNAKRHALIALGMTEEEFAKDAGLKGTRYIDVIEKLMKTEDEQEIRILLTQPGLDLTVLRERIKEYPRIHFKDLTSKVHEDMVMDLVRKINIVSNEQRKKREQDLLKQKLQEQRLNDIKKFELFKELIESSKIKETDIRRKLTSKIYERVLNLLKTEEPKTYKQYMKALKYRRIASEKADELIKSKILKLLAYLTNGIEVDGKLKKFNMIDCYEKFGAYTDLLSAKVNLFERTLPVPARANIKNFLKHTMDAPLTQDEISSILNGTFEFDCEKDEKGNNVKGTGTIIPREEKENWFIYLKDNNIPTTYHNVRLLEEQTKENLRQVKVYEKKCN